MEERTCNHCGRPIPPRITAEMRELAARVHMILPAPGRSPRFCSPAHRERARLRRKRGLPEDAYPEGGRRGRVRLGELTRDERVADWKVKAEAIAVFRATADLLAREVDAEPSVYENHGIRSI